MSELNLDKIRVIAIIGDPNSGKTNLAINFLREYVKSEGKREVFLYGYPKPIDGFKQIQTKDDLMRLKNSVVFMDELSRVIKTYDKRANTDLMEWLSFNGHKNNTLVFTTQLSQFITRGVEALIDCWAIKQIDVDMLKNGSKPKKILQKVADHRLTSLGLCLEKNEYVLFVSGGELGLNGVRSFKDQGVGKDWGDTKVDESDQSVGVVKE